eukprot:scaffold3597_cov395-Prasinococcus_capsulatus_cf.AAC.9
MAESERRFSGTWAQTTLDGIAKGCPFTVLLTWEHFKVVLANQPTLEEVMRLELRLAVRCTNRHDFVEGVRAALIRKVRRQTALKVVRFGCPLGERASALREGVCLTLVALACNL